jgi:hypothetical protein
MRTPNYVATVEGILKKCVPELNNEEYVSIHEVLTHNFIPRYEQQGDFSVAFLVESGQQVPLIFVGVTKKHPDDAKNPFRGKCTALARAVRSLITRLYKIEFKGE